MQHDWERYFDTKSDYWEKIQKIYKENDNYPKVVVSGRNLHHKFLRSFSRLEGTEIDNDKENLVSLSEGDHFLVHYYLWKCTKTGYKNRTALAVRFMYKKAAKYLTDEIAELIAKEWVCCRDDCRGWKGKKLLEETKKKISDTMKKKGGNSTTWKKGHQSWCKGKPSNTKGKKWFTNGIENKMSFTCPEGFWEGVSKKRGKTISAGQKKKISEAHKGKHWKLVDGKRIWY